MADRIVRGDPDPRGAEVSRNRPIVTSARAETGSVLIGAIQIVTVQIESDGPAPRGQKDGRIIKVSSESNAEKAGGMAMKAKELP